MTGQISTRAKNSHNEPVFQNILEKIYKIGWDIAEIDRNVSVIKEFAEQVLGREDNFSKKRFYSDSHYYYNDKDFYVNKQKRGRSAIFVSNVVDITEEDRQFIYRTEYMDLIFRSLFENNPHILFTYIINEKGISRGYPWKDFSILDSGFNPSKMNFFYIADIKHDPGKEARWTEPYLCPLSREWMVTCSCPVYKKDDFAGIVGIDVDLEKIIAPLGDTLRMTKGCYAFLVSPNGNLIISSNEGMDRLREDYVLVIEKWREMDEWKTFPSGMVRAREVTLTSGQAFFLHTCFKTNKWDLICILPKHKRKVPKMMLNPVGNNPAEDVRRSPKQLNSGKPQLPLMTFIASFSESLKEIEKLIEGTKTIGSGILDFKIVTKRKDEIGLLAIAINKMAEELKKRKVELEAAYRKINRMDRLSALGILAAGISHELNNPLGIISNCIQLLLRNDNLQPFIKQDLLIVEEEIARMSEIIKQLLNLSRDSELKMNVINVNEILQRTLAFIKFRLKSHSINLIEDYSNNLPFILGDSTRLHQMFLNIFLNSIQAMSKKGGDLTIVTKCADNILGLKEKQMVQISISDTGIGIEKQFIDKIFDPFFTSREPGEGTGLGLSIAYSIVKEHRGDIDVKSGPFKGTAMIINLPVFAGC
ncbi:MAG: Sensor protein ZraS [Syntrophorhabdus sp. PtaU1.Bin058]|nr:MAG: Sensor protein ZraS [Syntrophorhabdus sp. PtaU1.Bin058]